VGEAKAGVLPRPGPRPFNAQVSSISSTIRATGERKVSDDAAVDLLGTSRESSGRPPVIIRSFLPGAEAAPGRKETPLGLSKD